MLGLILLLPLCAGLALSPIFDGLNLGATGPDVSFSSLCNPYLFGYSTAIFVYNATCSGIASAVVTQTSQYETSSSWLIRPGVCRATTLWVQANSRYTVVVSAFGQTNFTVNMSCLPRSFAVGDTPLSPLDVSNVSITTDLTTFSRQLDLSFCKGRSSNESTLTERADAFYRYNATCHGYAVISFSQPSSVAYFASNPTLLFPSYCTLEPNYMPYNNYSFRVATGQSYSFALATQALSLTVSVACVPYTNMPLVSPLCSVAGPVLDGVTNVSLASARTPAFSSSCGAQEAFFTYNATCTGNAILSKNAIFRFVAVAESCDSLASYSVCQEQAMLSVVARRLYYVRVSGQGNVTLNISCTPVVTRPPNDECVGAQPIVDGTVILQNISSATSSLSKTSGCFASLYFPAVPTLWYRYTASCTGAVVVTAPGFFCLRTTSCVNGCVVGNGCVWGSIAGETYYLAIGITNVSAPSFQISCSAPKEANNDFCSGALAVTDGSITAHEGDNYFSYKATCNGNLITNTSVLFGVGCDSLLLVGSSFGVSKDFVYYFATSQNLTISCQASPRPNGDLCNDAILIADDNTSVSTDASSATKQVYPNDLFYRFTASCSGTATVVSTIQNFQSFFHFETNNCSSLDSSLDEFSGSSSLLLPVFKGRSYLFGSFNLASSPIYQIRTSCNNASKPTAYDFCCDAQVITDGPTPASNAGATTQRGISFAGVRTPNEIFFRYTATCSGDATLSVPSNFVAAVYSGSSCDDLGLEVDVGSVVKFGVQKDRTYFLAVASSYPNFFHLDLSCTPVARPTADECSGALAVTEGEYIKDNTNASKDFSSCGVQALFGSVWFVYTPSQTGLARIVFGKGGQTISAAAFRSNNDNCVHVHQSCNSGPSPFLSLPVIANRKYFLTAGDVSSSAAGGPISLKIALLPSNVTEPTWIATTPILSSIPPQVCPRELTPTPSVSAPSASTPTAPSAPTPSTAAISASLRMEPLCGAGLFTLWWAIVSS